MGPAAAGTVTAAELAAQVAAQVAALQQTLCADARNRLARLCTVIDTSRAILTLVRLFHACVNRMDHTLAGTGIKHGKQSKKQIITGRDLHQQEAAGGAQLLLAPCSLGTPPQINFRAARSRQGTWPKACLCAAAARLQCRGRSTAPGAAHHALAALALAPSTMRSFSFLTNSLCSRSARAARSSCLRQGGDGEAFRACLAAQAVPPLATHTWYKARCSCYCKD